VNIFRDGLIASALFSFLTVLALLGFGLHMGVIRW